MYRPGRKANEVKMAKYPIVIRAIITSQLLDSKMVTRVNPSRELLTDPIVVIHRVMRVSKV